MTHAHGDCRYWTSPRRPRCGPLIAAALSVDAARGGAGRPVLLVSSTYREAEELTAALQSLLGEEAVAYYPAWETLPHERLSPRSDTVGRRLELLRRLAGNSDLPRAADRGRAGAQRPAAASQGPWEPEADTPGRRRGDRPDRARGGPGRCGVHACRPGRAARRVRGTRRHRRRLSADRGAPRTRGLLRRHGRGDPLLLRRRPAVQRHRADRDHGLAVSRAAADRRRTRPRSRARRSTSRTDRDARQDRPGAPGRRHGGTVAGLWWTAWSC